MAIISLDDFLWKRRSGRISVTTPATAWALSLLWLCFSFRRKYVALGLEVWEEEDFGQPVDAILHSPFSWPVCHSDATLLQLPCSGLPRTPPPLGVCVCHPLPPYLQAARSPSLAPWVLIYLPLVPEICGPSFPCFGSCQCWVTWRGPAVFATFLSCQDLKTMIHSLAS